jgi:hypothetical protein
VTKRQKALAIAPRRAAQCRSARAAVRCTCASQDPCEPRDPLACVRPPLHQRNGCASSPDERFAAMADLALALLAKLT